MFKSKLITLFFIFSFLFFTGSTFAADTEPNEASPEIIKEKSDEVSSAAEEDEEPDC